MGGQRSAPSCLHPLLSLLLAATVSRLWAFPFSASLDLDVTPRTTVLSKGEEADGITHPWLPINWFVDTNEALKRLIPIIYKVLGKVIEHTIGLLIKTYG